MKTTFDREAFVKAPTAELARQIDDILDHRHERVMELPREPKPIAMVRTLLLGLSTRK